jgi:predicted HicB family RNase H-like nuclease
MGKHDDFLDEYVHQEEMNLVQFCEFHNANYKAVKQAYHRKKKDGVDICNCHGIPPRKPKSNKSNKNVTSEKTEQNQKTQIKKKSLTLNEYYELTKDIWQSRQNRDKHVVTKIYGVLQENGFL